MNILKEKEFPLLKRKRITAEMEHFKKPTPTKLEIVKKISQEMKVQEENISLLHAYPHFGREKTKIIANIYASKEDKDFVEKINKKKKKEATQEKPKEEEKK